MPENVSWRSAAVTEMLQFPVAIGHLTFGDAQQIFVGHSHQFGSQRSASRCQIHFHDGAAFRQVSEAHDVLRTGWVRPSDPVQTYIPSHAERVRAQ